MRGSAVGSIVGLLVLAVVTSCATAPAAPPQVEVKSAQEFTGTLDGTPGSTNIGWTPAFMVTNRGSAPVDLLDVETDFPYGVDEQTKETIDLVPARPTTAVRVYRSLEEIRDDRPTATVAPPITLQPQESIYVRPEQTLMITSNGRPVTLRGDLRPLDYLGPFLRLPPEPGGGYHCALGVTLPLIVHTGQGDVGAQADQALLPVGCSLNLPN